MVSCIVIQAHGLRLNGYINDTFNDKFDTYYRNTSYLRGTIKGSIQWGAGLEYLVSPDYGIELVYYSQDTQAPISYYYNGDLDDILEIGINYIIAWWLTIYTTKSNL